jgi:DNA-binding XRE family transcriptional regulator
MAKRKQQVAGTLIVEGVEYIVIPKAEYLRMQDVQPTSGSVDARTFVRRSIAVDLRAAREHARLTQAELAKRMGKSQTLVSQAESGTARISERYVHAVLATCGLPANWSGPRSRKAPARRKSA